MNPHTGELFASIESARSAGVEDAVEIRGTREAVETVSQSVAAQHRTRTSAAARRRNKAARKARRATRRP